MKRRILLTCAALLVALGLSACGQTQADVQRDAKFAKICHEQGGSVWYNGGNQISCDFSDS